MGPRRFVATLALAAALGVAAAPGRCAAAASPTPRPPSASPPSGVRRLAPTPPPRPPAASINITACTAAYKASHDGGAFLCCVDPSLGFCGGRLEAAPDGALCTLDWRTFPSGPGRQCCARPRPDAAGATPPLTATAAWARTGPRPPYIDVTCRAYGACAANAVTRQSQPNEKSPNETVTRCGSWAPASYRRCDARVCVSRRARNRGINVRMDGRWKKTLFCGRSAWGTAAQCCQYKKTYAERTRCCRGCRVPGRPATSWGCCWPGKKAKVLF